MKAFYEKHKKPIILFVAFVVVCLIATTIYNGDVNSIVTNP